MTMALYSVALAIACMKALHKTPQYDSRQEQAEIITVQEKRKRSRISAHM